MADDFANRGPVLDSPAESGVAVTPHDSNDLPNVTRALWVGVAGDVSVEMKTSGTALVFKNAQGLLPYRVTRVNSTNTTATDIVALW